MKKENIHLADWKRIVLGDAPLEFMLEILIRTSVVYVVLIIVVRLLGKRMSGQLSQTEMAVMVTLGAIVSPAMQLPDRGVLPGLMALVIILFLFRNANLQGVRHRKLEHLMHGTESLLVKDGVLQLDELGKTRVSHQQLLAAIRAKEIYNLGEVSRVYLEPSGDFSIYTADEKRPGLSTLPQTDDDIHQLQQPVEGRISCCNCGTTIEGTDKKTATCPNCGQKTWDGTYL